MSDTPETDASCGYALSSHYGRLEGSYLQMDWSGPFVHAEVARKLERERDEAIRQRNETNESSVFSCNFYYEEKLKAERERDQLKQLLAADSERVDAYLGVCIERDEAREALREIWQSGDAFLPYIDQETITRWRKVAGWEETK